ncbi:Ohr subfamily peroxiredoxin [Diaminobutyricimonas aerilata]|uniref:Ohr subfamily peroxiredoxin n=1 Tax=Diaminobutyricimonas aerilata TaxID=1162967 RepID=A0A2M9CNR2_9MICO|nr:Ohr family peroxiredoxin [Diaminobutyricimonas aerilata]PJJ73526.1 Ohr subfamily peroxiredoxin [Diaminobutyricimonas aerilata]
METLYTAIAHATGGENAGHVRSEDDRIDFDTRQALEGDGEGSSTNPQQLFAAGYAASFLSALHGAGAEFKTDTSEAAVSATVELSRSGEGYTHGIELVIYLPKVAAEQREQVVERAFHICPYSNSIRGNIEVTRTLVD